jgi:N-ethylmaleimide reductase
MLNSSYALGNLTLNNRMVMAPMTRCRSLQPGNIPGPINALYYGQRASAGLIVTEGAQISPQGQGYPWTPGIHTDAQAKGWQKIVEATHAAGGKVFLQLWHVGRISHPLIQPNGEKPIAPSAITPKGEVFALDKNGQPKLLPFEQPRALGIEELPRIVTEYAEAAKRAMESGMDGVEIHAANGYLLDQFLCNGTNQRTDAYGGSIENRIRLILEVVDAVIKVCGAERTGIRISPFGVFNDMADENPEALFEALARALAPKNLAYLHIVDPTFLGATEDIRTRGKALMTTLRQAFPGTIILCGDYTQERAEAALNEGRADLIGFGRPFISNPDLPERIRLKAPLHPADPATFYSGGAQGYIDYPTLRQDQGLDPSTDLSAFS